MPKALQFHNSAFSSGSYSIPLDVRRAKIDPKILNSPYTPLRVCESKAKTLNPEPEARNPKPAPISEPPHSQSVQPRQARAFDAQDPGL